MTSTRENNAHPLRIAIELGNITTTGGMHHFSVELANHLVQEGHDVYGFTPSPQGTTPCFKYHKNIHLVTYTQNSSKQSTNELHKKLIQYNPDLVIVPNSYKVILIWCEALIGTDIPLLYSEHSDPWNIITQKWSKSERESVLWFADNIHLLMPTFIQSVPETLHHKVRTIYNPLSTSIASSKKAVQVTAEACYTILSLGRLDPKPKQIRLLIAAFALLAQEFPQWKLDIWGTGPDEEALREQISTLPQDIQQRVHLCGLAKNPTEQYSTADIFCIPSRFEGFGLTVTEAMAHSLPVVGFASCNGVNGLVHHEENGLLAPEMTAESLAGELRRLMQDTELRQQLGQQAKEDAKNFAPEYIYPQWEELIYAAASKKGHPQHSHVYDENISKNERPYQATMRQVLARPDIDKDTRCRRRLRRWIRKHPNHANMINGILRKLGLAIVD